MFFRYYKPDNNCFLVGMSNKKIIQFDARTDDIIQEYDHIILNLYLIYNLFATDDIIQECTIEESL